jgi:hypothetical protein
MQVHLDPPPPPGDRAGNRKEDSRVMSLDTPNLMRERLEPMVSSTERAALLLDGRGVLSLSLSVGCWLPLCRRGTSGSSEESLSLAREGGE